MAQNHVALVVPNKTRGWCLSSCFDIGTSRGLYPLYDEYRSTEPQSMCLYCIVIKHSIIILLLLLGFIYYCLGSVRNGQVLKEWSKRVQDASHTGAG